MKFIRTYLVVTFFSVAVIANAQQVPHYTQYIMNNFIINPAVAGIENYWDMKLSHRLQWVGLQDAPVTTYFTIHGPLKKSSYDIETPTSFHRAGFNPRGDAYWQEYQSTEPHVGIGFNIINDRTGPLNKLAAGATLAYHVGISPKTSLSAGITFGINQMTIDAEKLIFKDPDPKAISVIGGLVNRINPDLAAGLWLYSRDYFLGLSAQQIIPQRLHFSDSVVVTEGKLVPHIFITGGYRLFVSEDVSFLPSIVLRYVQPLPLGIDVNAKFQYQDLFWVGGSYRYQDGFAGMLGLNISNAINIGYSYDITTSQLNTVSHGTHELLIGFLIGNRYGDWCPRNNW